MSATLTSLKQERWFVILMAAGLLALAILVVADFGVGLPDFPRPVRRPNGAPVKVPVSEIESVLLPAALTQPGPPTNALNPFYTAYFLPPQARPPTTRKIDLTYQGFYRTAEGEKRAFIKVGDRLFVGPAGSNVVADLSVADISLRTLTLRSLSAQTNSLEFNVKKELEIPVQ